MPNAHPDTSSLKIERDIPPPSPASGRGEGVLGLLLRMEPGDSVLFPASVSNNAAQSRVSDARARHPDRRFVTRAVEGGRRVWRIA